MFKKVVATSLLSCALLFGGMFQSSADAAHPSNGKQVTSYKVYFYGQSTPKWMKYSERKVYSQKQDNFYFKRYVYSNYRYAQYYNSLFLFKYYWCLSPVQKPVVETPKGEDPKQEEVPVPEVEQPTDPEVPVVKETPEQEPEVVVPEEKPKVEEPVIEEPKTEVPVVEEPKVEEPKTEEPKVEKPKVEEPKVETPQPEKPKVESNELNQFEQQVVNLTNQERTKHGLTPFKIDNTLSKAAREKSRDMATRGYFSHNSPTYGSPFDMMRQFGVSYSSAAENIAKGQSSPEQVVQSWMNSPGHKANILNGKLTHIGVGFVEQGNHWTQMFISK